MKRQAFYLEAFKVLCGGFFLASVAMVGFWMLAAPKDTEGVNNPIARTQEEMREVQPPSLTEAIRLDDLSRSLEEGRSDKWESFAHHIKGINPQCAACGVYGDDREIQAHHIHAFKLMSEEQRGSSIPGGELDPNNIILLCRFHHLTIGHLGNYRDSNPNVVADAAKTAERIKEAGTWPERRQNESRVLDHFILYYVRQEYDARGEGRERGMCAVRGCEF